ncbi:MAG: NfeD family protein [Magnetococcales bacterium]|nr:NfeD family protein [Magnetococcales bacterium]
MVELLTHLNHYHWWIIGILLVILEVLAPAFFFLWMGFAAGLVGVALLIFPELGWKSQLLTFSLLSVVSIYLSREYLKKKPIATDQPTLNRRGSQYIGRFFTLTSPIVNQVGRIQVDDSIWKVVGPDLAIGEKIRVIEVQGTDLIVEPAEPQT